MQRTFSLIASLALAYSAALIGSLFTVDAINGWYAALTKPELNPPNWIFGPVWTVLYALMAIAAWRIYEKRNAHPSARKTLLLYAVHLVLNALWSIAFFGLQMPLLALGIIIALLICIIGLIILFRRIDRLAMILFLPYLAWVSFATYLNLMIVLLN